MTMPNHVAGGIVFTGIFAAISGANLFSEPWYIGITILATLVPDLDHPQSFLGRVFRPVSKYINKHHGHRTLTHSFLALVVTTFLIWLFDKYTFETGEFAIFWFWAYLSHIFLDMLTISGVHVFYPFAHRPAVVPGNEKLRVRTGDRKTEMFFFVFFFLTSFWLTPLFTNGWWTSYNRMFGTMAHLGSEYRKSDDLLEVDFKYRIGSENFEGKGFCVEATDKFTTLILSNKEFLRLETNDKMVVDQVVPSHTGDDYFFENLNFISIGLDSINELVKDKRILEIELLANQPFLAHTGKEDEKPDISQRFKGNYLTGLKIEDKRKLVKRVEVEFVKSPRIATIEKKIQLKERENRNRKLEIENQKSKILELESKLDEVTDLYDKQKLVESLNEWRNKKLREPNYEEIALLKSEIQELRGDDKIKYKSKLVESENKFLESMPDDLRFTGSLRFVRIEKKKLAMN